MIRFGQKVDPKEQAKKWKGEMRKEMRAMDRQIMSAARAARVADASVR